MSVIPANAGTQQRASASAEVIRRADARRLGRPSLRSAGMTRKGKTSPPLMAEDAAFGWAAFAFAATAL